MAGLVTAEEELRRRYLDWREERRVLWEMEAGAHDGPPSAFRWEASDDTAVELLHECAELLGWIEDASDEPQ